MADDPEVFRLPRLLDEGDVAAALHCSVATVKRERQRGRLGFTRIGRGRVRYTEDQVAQYLHNQREDPACPSKKTDSGRSADIGSANSGAAQSGAVRGSIRPTDKLTAHRLALSILKKPDSSSPDG
jgi:hypothetical protein